MKKGDGQPLKSDRMKPMILKWTKWLCGAVLLGSVAPAGWAADHEGPDLKRGEKVPWFSLSDQSGVTHTLAGLLGQNKKLAVVFYRSADW